VRTAVISHAILPVCLARRTLSAKETPSARGGDGKVSVAAVETDAKAGLPAVIYELRVRDVVAAAKFYRDRIGMRTVAECEGDVMLSLFGTGLRLLAAWGANTARLPDRAANPLVELLAANGFR